MFDLAIDKNPWGKIVSVLVSITAFLFLAFQNGYPFIYPDTGTYVYSGFARFVPVDRPIFYGLFLRHISLAWSLWLPVIVQAFIAYYLVFLSFRYIVKSPLSFTFSLFSCILLSCVSTIGYHIGILIPDVFSSFLFLSIVILFFGDGVPKGHLIMLIVLIIFSSMVHYSNLLSLTIISSGFFLFYLFKKNFAGLKKKSALLFVIMLSLWIGIPAINSLYGYGFHYSKSTHVITMAKMIERGILPQYLNEHCPTENLLLCKKKLPPDPFDFLYDTNGSPLYDDSCLQSGWPQCWENRKDECNKIIGDILTDKKYRWPLLKSVASDFIKQLSSIGVDHSKLREKDAHVFQTIMHYFPRGSNQFRNSLQYTSGIPIAGLIKVHKVVVIISVFFLVGWLIKNFSRKTLMVYFVTALMLFNLVNSLVNSVFNMVDARFQDRIIWLFPFSMMLILLPQFSERKNQTGNAL